MDRGYARDVSVSECTGVSVSMAVGTRTCECAYLVPLSLICQVYARSVMWTSYWRCINNDLKCDVK